MHFLGERNLRPKGPFKLNESSWQAEGLVTWYPMHQPGQASIIDLSGRGFNGTFGTNKPTWRADHEGPVLRFGVTTADSVTFSDPLGSSFTNATLWFWLRSHNNGGSGCPAWMTADASLFSHYPFANSVNDYYSNHLRSTRQGPFSINVGGTKSWTTEHWHALCIRTAPGASQWQFWVQALMLASATGDATVTIPSNKWLLGYSSSTQAWGGFIAEFRVYSRTLSQPEIVELSKPNNRFDLYRPYNPRTYAKSNATAGGGGGGGTSGGQVIIAG